MTSKIRTATISVLVAGLVGAGAPAPASDHRPPKTVVAVGAKEQRGRLGTYCWTEPSPPGFLTSCADAIYSWPKARRVQPGGQAVVRFLKAQPPREVSILRWRRVYDYGYPKGRAREVDFTLRPAASDDGLVWEAVFALPAKPGHVYLDVFGGWSDEEGSFVDQDASWTFHLQLRDA